MSEVKNFGIVDFSIANMGVVIRFMTPRYFIIYINLETFLQWLKDKDSKLEK